MTPKDKKKKILLILENEEKRGELSKTGENHFAIPETLENSLKARNLISDKDERIVGIFFNAAEKDANWIQLLKDIFKYRPGIPVFMISDEAVKLTQEELNKLGIIHLEQEPKNFNEVSSLVEPLIKGFDFDSALKTSDRDTVSVDTFSEDDLKEFSPIKAENFLSGKKSLFDIYVELKRKEGDKFLKILQAGDQFEPDRVNKYLKKGVHYFFVKKEAQSVYLEYCAHLSSRILKNKNISAEVKSKFVMNYGEETMSFLKNNGISEKQINTAKDYISNVNNLVRQLKPKSQNILDNFLKDVSSFEHGASTAMIASMMTEALNMDSFQAVQILGLSALFHDIGLLNASDVLRNEDMDKMSEKELEEFKKHPDKGSTLLEGLPDIAPAISQSIKQHHARRGESGFPEIKPSQITLISAVVGISDEFAKLISKSLDNPGINPIKEMEEYHFDTFSRPIVQAFNETFILGAALR